MKTRSDKGCFHPNAVRYEGDIAFILLTNPLCPQTGTEAIVDSEDAERILNYGRWLYVKFKGITEYVCARRDRKGKLLHRFVLNAPENSIIDHINANGLDCRKCNLRFVNRMENAQNLTHAHADSKTGHRNVYPLPDGRYAVQISVRGKRTTVGAFANINEAIQAATIAREQLQSHSPENSRKLISQANNTPVNTEMEPEEVAAEEEAKAA